MPRACPCVPRVRAAERAEPASQARARIEAIPCGGAPIASTARSRPMSRATLTRPGAAILAGLTLLAVAARADVGVPEGFVDERIASGMDMPTSFAFLPD